MNFFSQFYSAQFVIVPCVELVCEMFDRVHAVWLSFAKHVDTSGVTVIFLTAARSEENQNALWETSVDVLCLGQSSNIELS